MRLDGRGIWWLLPVLTAVAAISCGDGGGGHHDGEPNEVDHCTLSAQTQACLSATTQATCNGAGGVWRVDGFEQKFHCFCQTGQRECVCTGSGTCAGMCLADDPPPGGSSCGDVHTGHCTAATPNFGCFCTLDFDTFGPSNVCFD